MKVICCVCKQEYDWNANDIFLLPIGWGNTVGSMLSFKCRSCLMKEKWYRKVAHLPE